MHVVSQCSCVASLLFNMTYCRTYSRKKRKSEWMMYVFVSTIHNAQSSTRQLNGHWPPLSTTSHNCYNFKSEFLSTKHIKPTYCTSFVGQFQTKIELFLNEMVDNLAICHWNVCRHAQLIEDWTNPFWQLTNVCILFNCIDKHFVIVVFLTLVA